MTTAYRSTNHGRDHISVPIETHTAPTEHLFLAVATRSGSRSPITYPGSKNHTVTPSMSHSISEASPSPPWQDNICVTEPV